jgi:uncharacterized protein GlcG (DUF336 family)
MKPAAARAWAVLASGIVAAGSAHAQATFESRSITPEAALRAARAALAACSKSGYQVAVAVTDRAGIPLVMLRDRHAGAHTPQTAIGKAWTAVSFRTDTLSLAQSTRPGEPSAGIRNLPGVVAVGGGRGIDSAGSQVGGIGVSGAPGGDADDACARAGLAEIADDLQM